MKAIKYILFSVTCIAISSCMDILDKKPLTAIGEGDLWADPALVQGFVNSRYNQVGHGWTESMQSSCVDETDLIWGGRGTEPIIFDYISPTELGRVNGGWYGWDNRSWGTKWTNISNCNIFFERIGEVPFADESLRTRLMGEVRFVRCFEYWDLIQRWGAMPLITQSFTISDMGPILDQSRATYKECIDWLVSELDDAATELPASFSGANYGRATSVAAKALKARILLYAASPLMNDGVTMPQLGYTTPEANRWERAATAAQEVIDFAIQNGYGLYKSNSDPALNYQEIFLNATSSNNEVLFARMGTESSQNQGLGSVEQWNMPNGYGGWGGNSPLSELVDDYQMADGTPFSWDNVKAGDNPYVNREPRFYASINYDGAMWRGRPIENFNTVDAAGNITGGGKDTTYGIDNWNSSSTGYNMRKFLDESYVPNSNNFPFKKNWIWLRLAEQYLNLAEALYHTGDEAGARDAVNVIRDRAGLPDITSTGATLLEDIKHERRIELVFEEHRFYDVRRWKEGEKYFNSEVHGIDIFHWPDGRVTYKLGKLKQSVSGVRSFSAKQYWMPILQGEIDKNPKLIQNPLY
ncbi:MAG: RagB/SusD family nutrient uptake outer membrane protein [Prevotellaceae bacterium]|nr:RagB/SusD family nutrient uptake outer membrane protein [Prevotellaceae bacterium]